MRTRRTLIALTAVTSLVACRADSTSQPDATTMASTTALSTSPTSDRPSPTETSTDGEPAAAPVGEPIPFSVEGRPLPTAVVATYRDRGGQLLQTATILKLLGMREIPFPSAMGVVVTDAVSHVEAVEPGVVTRDEGIGWLFVDDDTLGDLIDGLAEAAGLTAGGWSYGDTTSTVSGADCTERIYTHPTTPVTWTLSGCGFAEFAGLRAVQVRRAGTFLNVAPLILVPENLAVSHLVQIQPTSRAAGLALTAWGVDVTQPDASGTTTTVSFRFTADAPGVAGALRAALTWWTELAADEDHGVRFRAGADEWEVTATEVVFTSRGRVPE